MNKKTNKIRKIRKISKFSGASFISDVVLRTFWHLLSTLLSISKIFVKAKPSSILVMLRSVAVPSPLCAVLSSHNIPPFVPFCKSRSKLYFLQISFANIFDECLSKYLNIILMYSIFVAFVCLIVPMFLAPL